MISALCLLTSCMSFSDKPLRPVRNSIDQQLPEISLEKEFGISIGGGMFDFLDVITFNEADISEIDHIQVGVYKIHPRGGNVEFTDAVFAEALLAKEGNLSWDRIVKVREDNEQVWVYVGMDLERSSLEAISVFVLEQDELVLINMDGDFDEMLEYAMEPARGHRGAYKAG